MSPQGWAAVVGAVAAVCTTAAFVPQVVKIRRQGGRDLSYGMLLLYLVGVVLWLGYGLLTGAWSVIVANAAAALLVSASLVLKRGAETAGPRRRVAPGRRSRIAIDMDEVIADSLSKHLRAYNEAFADRLTLRDLQGRSLEDAVPPGRAAPLREILLAPDFFADLRPVEGSQEVVRELADRYEVFIASAAMEVPTSFAAKYAWLRQHFPFISPSHVVFCGDKGVLDVDWLIDDTPRHFQRFRGTPVLFSAPHNRDEERFLRATGWADVRRMLLGPDPASG